MTNTPRYPMVIHEDGDGWHLYYPDLPGCQTYAETWDELLTNARQVLTEWTSIMRDAGRAIPPPTPADVLPWDVDWFTKEAGQQ